MQFLSSTSSLSLLKRLNVNVSYKTVLYSESDRIATITLNRADKRNAISYELIDDLLAALKQAADSPAQIVILTGAGKAFCSGMDLDNLKQLTGRTHEQNLRDSETMASLFRTLYDFPKPTIAAVNGAGHCGRHRPGDIVRFHFGRP